VNAPAGNLHHRMKIQSRLRAALEKRGYLEVITPSLQPCPGSDPEIEPFTITYSPLMEPEPPARILRLHTSPEFAMKRLLCRGFQAIYQICQVFRQGEQGPWHSPEFTMAEWYRPGWTYQELMAEVEEITAEVAGPAVTWGGKKIILEPPLPRISVSRACHEAGVDMESWAGLAREEWLFRFSEAFAVRLEPWLKKQGALFLGDFPAPAAILSRLKPHDPLTAERFELIIAGVEIANGCTELTDPQEHRRRYAEDCDIRRQRGKPVIPPPEPFFRDLETLGLPPCAGVALGVDRLAMLALGAERIEEVQAFPFAR